MIQWFLYVQVAVAIATGLFCLGMGFGGRKPNDYTLGATALVLCSGLRFLQSPRVRPIDAAWLSTLAGRFSHLFTLDNHYLDGGQGERICSALVAQPPRQMPRVHRLGLRDIPVCGTNAEVLRAHGLDAASIARVAAEW